MKTDLSNWQDLRMDFFLEEVLERFWNHAKGTVDKVIEVQYYTALFLNRFLLVLPKSGYLSLKKRD